jgi:hypothetical protein
MNKKISISWFTSFRHKMEKNKFLVDKKGIKEVKKAINELLRYIIMSSPLPRGFIQQEAGSYSGFVVTKNFEVKGLGYYSDRASVKLKELSISDLAKIVEGIGEGEEGWDEIQSALEECECKEE